MSLPFGGRPHTRHRVNRKSLNVKEKIGQHLKEMLLANPVYNEDGCVVINIPELCQDTMLPSSFKRYTNNHEDAIFMPIEDNFYRIYKLDIDNKDAGNRIFDEPYWKGDFLYLPISKLILDKETPYTWERYVEYLKNEK